MVEGQKTPARKKARGERTFWAKISARHDPLTSLLFTIPVFLTYHLGILLIDLRNGVDLVSQLTFELLERSLPAYVAVTVGVAIGIAVAVYVLRGKGRLKPAEWGPMLIESTLLAVVMLFTVGWATHQLFDWQTGPPPMGPLDKIVMAAGAGFHEELVFRAGLFAGGAALLARFTELGRTKSLLISAFVGALIFSGVHYVGVFGDPFTFVSFTFRALAGLFLTAVYHYRGFAVAVYTHTIYDLIVFFLR